MLEEYVCLGGNEVANNARAYGYATSAGCPSSWFRCVPCESIHDVTTDWIPPTYRTYEIAKNYAPNPSMEKASAGVEVRKNLAQNPSFEFQTAATQEVRRNLASDPRALAQAVQTGKWAFSPRWFGGSGTGTVTNVTGAADGPAGGPNSYIRKTWTNSGAGPGDTGYSLAPSDAPTGVYTNGVPVVAGEVYTVSVWIRAIWTGAQRLSQIAVFFRDAAGNPVTNLAQAAQGMVTNVWQRLSYTFTVPAGAALVGANVDPDQGPNWATGDRFDATGLLVEKNIGGNVAGYVGDYFDGSMPAAGDFSYAWTGTVNNSPSVQTGISTQFTYGSVGQVTPIQSTEWAASGTKSMRLIPNQQNNVTYWFASPQAFGWTAGKTYTVIATSRLKAPLTGTLEGRSRKLMIRPGGGLPDVYGEGMPNAAGAVQQRATVTLNATDVSGAGIYLWNGAGLGGGDIWWDDLLVVEGNYTGPYFDGSTPAKVRRNIMRDPSARTETGWAQYFTSGGGTASLVTGATDGPEGASTYRRFVTSGGAGIGGQFVDTAPNSIAAGAQYAGSVWVRSSVAKKMGLTFEWQSATASVGDSVGPTVDVPANTWVQLSLVDTARPGATWVRLAMFNREGTWGDGILLDAGRALLEAAPSVGVFFDGATPLAPYSAVWEGTPNASPSYLYDPDFTYVWNSTPNDSTSGQRGVGVASYSPGGAVSIQSNHWMSNRAKSMRLVSAWNTPGSAYADVAGTGFEQGLVAGKTYTLSVVVRMAAARGAGVDPPSVGIPASLAGYSKYVLGQDIAGEQTITMTFTVPPSGWWYLRLYNNAPYGLPDVWFDSLMIVEGESSIPYFDGDSAESTPDDDIRWAGTPDASASIWERTTVEQQGQSATPPYVLSSIYDAPWYDSQYPDLTGRFYGVFVLGIENLNSSTRTATVTEGILDGGVVGLVRHTTREMRTRAILVADGEDALEYGLAWLSAALASDTCSTHGSSCGAVDMTFFASCPDSPDPNSTVTIDVPETRHIHNVTVTSGPLVEQKIKSNDRVHYGYIVEWTMVAGTPWVFSDTREVAVNLQPPVVVQDVPYNLVPYPSAELSNGTVTLATNYVTNPSMETDASGWNQLTTGITPSGTPSRSTEIAASGTASLKNAVTTTNSGTNGTLGAWRAVTLPAFVTGQRFSFTTWVFAAVVSGTAVLGSTQVNIEWRDSGGALVSSVVAGAGLASGGVISTTSLVRPPTATSVNVVAFVNVTSWSTGAVLNAFIDAVAVTIP